MRVKVKNQYSNQYNPFYFLTVRVKVYSAAKVRSHQQKTSRTKFWPHVHTDRIAFAPARKSYRIRLLDLFTHNNGGFGAISITEQSCTVPILVVDRHLTYIG